MKQYIFILLLFSSGIFNINGQDKPPVAVDDSLIFSITYNHPYDTIYLNPLINDYSQDEHPIKIFLVFGNQFGNIQFNDSIITYISNNFKGIDSIDYRIKDEVNNLVSDPGTIHVISTELSFGFLNENNINAQINSNGIHFDNYIGSNNFSQFEVPKYSNKRTITDFKLWIGGLDESSKLHFAPVWYEINMKKYEYWYGPISNNYDSTYDEKWDRVWNLH